MGNLSVHPDTAQATETVTKLAQALGGNTDGIILHYDEGSSYTFYAYMDLCSNLGI